MNPLLLLRDSWYFFSRHFGPIASLCLPVILLEALALQVASAWLGEASSSASDLLIRLVFYPLYTGALIVFLDSRSSRVNLKKKQIWSLALLRWPSFAVLAAFSTLLIMLGASLLILPGLWIMSRLVFAEYLLVLDGLSPMEAMKESFRMSDGHFLTILCCILLAMGPVWAFEWWAYGELGERPDSVASVFVDCLDGFLQLFTCVLIFRLFSLLGEPAAER